MKISYLIGAGASRNALPIVTEIPDRIEAIIERIKDKDGKISDEAKFSNEKLPLTKKKALQNLINDLQWLAENAKNHASIDTFAKKLFLKNNFPELKRLKVVLSIYFILEQASSYYDKRYDTFLASILNEDITNFPNNIRIISWNYDYQFERAYSEYSDSKEISDNQKRLNAFSKFTYKKHSTDRFAIFKINGTTNFIDPNWKNEHEYTDTFADYISLELIEKLLENYTMILHTDIKLYCNLSFAWETPTSSFEDLTKHTIAETMDTEILVIIGYSFPFFNRNIDREIIKGMTNLKRVYFQSPDAINIRERFLSIREDIKIENLLIREDVAQFLLPDEL